MAICLFLYDIFTPFLSPSDWKLQAMPIIASPCPSVDMHQLEIRLTGFHEIWYSKSLRTFLYILQIWLNSTDLSNFIFTCHLLRTSPTSGGRSVGIVRLRTKATEFIFYLSPPTLITGYFKVAPPVFITLLLIRAPTITVRRWATVMISFAEPGNMKCIYS
jgi:hypothetical protein